RQDLPFRQPPLSLGNGGDGQAEACPTGLRRERRTARRAGVRLGVEAPVGGVLILGAALLAHGEARHGGVRPVVRDVADDGVPRAAVGAIGESVPVPAVARIGAIGQARGAGGDVRRDQRELAGLRHARTDAEFAVAGGGQGSHDPILDPRQRRMLATQRFQETLDRRRCAFHFRDQAGGIVQNVPRQGQALRQVVHKRTEPHPLYNPPQSYLNALWHRCDKKMSRATTRGKKRGTHAGSFLPVFTRVPPRLLSCLNFTSIRRSAPFFGNWSRIPHPSRPAVPPRGWTTSRIASRRSGAARTCVPTREPTPSPGARDADLRAAASRRNPPAAAPWRPPRSFHPTALRRTRR